MMKPQILMRRLGISLQDLAAVTHSVKYFCTTSPGLTTFPEFVEVELVDEQPVSYYDVVLRRKIPKQDWVAKSEAPESWKGNTKAVITTEQTFKNIIVAKKHFSLTGGVHVVQNMFGCKCDDEAGQVTGYKQHGYDGKDLMSSNVETNTWIGPNLQDVVTTNKSNINKAPLAPWKSCISLIYPEWRRKYMNE